MRNMMLNRLRLKWKIFLYLLGFCALLLAVLWLFQTVLLDAFYRNIRVREVRSIAQEAAQSIGREDASDVIAELSENSDIIIEIFGADENSPPPDGEISRLLQRAEREGGEVLQYVSPVPPQQPDRVNQADGETQAAPPQPQRFWERRVPMRSLIYVKQWDTQIYIVVRAVISPVNATVDTLRYQLYVVSVIMLVFSIILAFLIARRVSKPIEEISRSAQALSRGEYGVRFGGKGFSEIVALSDTLNTAATELGRVESYRRELLANVSHDLRTPLALIYSYAEMMNDFPEEITREQTRLIMSESQRLTALVNDVLDTSKVESEAEQLSRAPYNLTRSLQAAILQMGELLKKDGFEIVFHRDEEVFVEADETKIDRVFYNLLINAVNYSGDCREIHVCQWASDDAVRVSVTDGGEGIAGEELPYIWERYYKSRKRHKRAVIGSGLGLSIVKRIVDLHGGSYGVESEYGKGSTFWFELRR